MPQAHHRPGPAPGAHATLQASEHRQARDDRPAPRHAPLQARHTGFERGVQRVIEQVLEAAAPVATSRVLAPVKPLATIHIGLAQHPAPTPPSRPR